MGPIRSLGRTETLRKGNREFALQSRWDRSLISVGPKCYERETKSLHCNLGRTDYTNSVGPIFGNRYIQRDYNPISVRPRSLSVRPKRLGFVAVAMTYELDGAG